MNSSVDNLEFVSLAQCMDNMSWVADWDMDLTEEEVTALGEQVCRVGV